MTEDERTLCAALARDAKRFLAHWAVVRSFGVPHTAQAEIADAEEQLAEAVEMLSDSAYEATVALN